MEILGLKVILVLWMVKDFEVRCVFYFVFCIVFICLVVMFEYMVKLRGEFVDFLGFESYGYLVFCDCMMVKSLEVVD